MWPIFFLCTTQIKTYKYPCLMHLKSLNSNLWNSERNWSTKWMKVHHMTHVISPPPHLGFHCNIFHHLRSCSSDSAIRISANHLLHYVLHVEHCQAFSHLFASVTRHPTSMWSTCTATANVTSTVKRLFSSTVNVCSWLYYRSQLGTKLMTCTRSHGMKI